MERWPYAGYPRAEEFRPQEVPDVATRRHPVVLVGPLLLVALPPVLVRWIDDHATVSTFDGKFLPLLAIVPMAIGALQISEWVHGWFIITQGRVMLFSGVLGQNKAMMPVQRVTDVANIRPIPRTLLGYCHVKIESAGQEQALHTVRFLAQPARVCQVLDLITDRPLGAHVELDPVPERSLHGGMLLLCILAVLAVPVAWFLG